MKQGKDRYKKIAKNFSFDDDIFDFLDGISKKVKGGIEENQYEQEMEEEEFVEELPKKKRKGKGKTEMNKIDSMIPEQGDPRPES